MKPVKYLTKRVTIAAATYGADKIEPGVVKLDATYDRVTGIAVHRVVDSGVANTDYSIGIQDDNTEHHEFSHISDWSTAKDDGTNPNERYKDFNFPIRGAGDLTCKVKLPAQVLATALQVEFTIRMEKDLTRIE